MGGLWPGYGRVMAGLWPGYSLALALELLPSNCIYC